MKIDNLMKWLNVLSVDNTRQAQFRNSIITRFVSIITYFAYNTENVCVQFSTVNGETAMKTRNS